MGNYHSENIGRIILAKRKEAGMTQETLAQLLHITPQAVSKWENGSGLPDLTLIPRIASVLEISPNELFGECGQKRANLPMVYKGMPFVCTDGNVALYSTKSVQEERDGVVYFSDGSEADLNGGVVTNCGAGEVRILQVQDLVTEWFDSGEERDSISQTFEGIHSLEITNSASCEVTVVRGEDGKTVLEAEGSKRFLSRLTISEHDRMLRVNAQQGTGNGTEHENHLKIKVGFDAGTLLKFSINGCGSASIEPSFQKAELVISGSGSIRLSNVGGCSVCISGSGTVAAKDIAESLNVTISGSGDVACADVKCVSVHIAGSGDLAVKELSGSLDASISGSGSIACTGGEVDTLRINVNGSGDLAAQNLTVGDAEITLRGSGSVALGRIKDKSVERLSKNSTLTVGKRG